MSAALALLQSPAANDTGGAVPRAGLPAAVAQAVWRADASGRQAIETVSSGWAELDAELPGAGWPRRSIVEILATQPAMLEWRLLAPGIRPVVDGGGQLVVIGPPRPPHLPGLQRIGLDDRRIVWIQADQPAERLWATEQLIKSGAAGAIIAWLPKARSEQIRRLQVCAQACEGLVFLCRPEAARHESSAAPLRLQASVGLDWELDVQILKRRGPPHEQPLALPSVPGGLASVLTPRVRRPSRLFSREVADVVGSLAVTTQRRQHAAA